jgi:hypothetical protein
MKWLRGDNYSCCCWGLLEVLSESKPWAVGPNYFASWQHVGSTWFVVYLKGI